MKPETPNNELSSLYIGKAVTLLDLACSLNPYCDTCLLRNRSGGTCILREVKKVLENNSQ